MEDDVFDLTDATIRDEPYVTVRRIAPRHGAACRYEKIFKRDVKHGYGDFTPWAERENYFLQWFALHNVEHVVRPAQINFLPTRDIASVVTYDAGITIAGATAPTTAGPAGRAARGRVPAPPSRSARRPA